MEEGQVPLSPEFAKSVREVLLWMESTQTRRVAWENKLVTAKFDSSGLTEYTVSTTIPERNRGEKGV